MNNNEQLEKVNTDIDKTKRKPKFPEKTLEEKVTTDTTEGAEKPLDENSQRSIQLQYASKNCIALGIRKKTYETGTILYKWDDENNCFTKQLESELEEQAFQWLEVNAPKFATDKMTRSAVTCLKYKLLEVPEAPKDNIIPLKNTWLKINAEEKKIELVKPTQDLFIDYTINTSLEFKEGDTTYTPQPLPADSLFKQYIESSQPKEDRRKLIQEYCGYTLLKENPFQVAQVFEGLGSDGKSVLMKLMKELHNNSNTTLDLHNLTDRNLIKLVGASLVIVPETSKKGIDEETFKKCISSDIISVKSLFQNPIDYVPTAKWIVSCNNFPYIADSTNGFWRRVQIIKWEVQFEGDKIIRDLENKIIKNEFKVFLDWCLEGLLRLLNRGYFDTSSIDAEKEKKKTESNSALAFIEQEGLELTDEKERTAYKMRKDEVYGRYTEFCEENGFSACNSTKFWLTVGTKIKGIDEHRRRVGIERKFFVNLRFNTSVDELPPTPPRPTETKQEPSKQVEQAQPITTQRTAEGEALHKAYEQQQATIKHEARIQTLIKEADKLLHGEEAPPAQTWELDGKTYTFKPAYLKALKEKEQQQEAEEL